MARLEILTHPDPRLRRVARPVEQFDEDLRLLVDDLIETMHAVRGVGLAAPQVGVGLRVVVIDLHERAADAEDDVPPEPLVLVNPRIAWRDGDIIWNEGCLSVPGVSADVDRAERVRVEAMDRRGRPLTLEASGLLAVCIQHEIDHLEGILYVDRLPPMERELVLESYREAKEAPAPAAP